MEFGGKPHTILMADDDAEDRMLVRDALAETGLVHELHCVCDGEELFDYLLGRGQFARQDDAARPQLILLDLKMPKKDGREVLRQLKSDPHLRHIPVVVLTTSTADDDVNFSYQMGVNSYITKPASFGALVELMATLSRYWFGCVRLPPASF